jgi:NhaP-type Na+/H+ or K+/H+ antiporter
VDLGFNEALLILGLLLAVVAALSGWLHGTVLSTSVLSVGVGLLLAVLGVVEVSASSTVLLFLVELALILTLFADGLFVESELLLEHWGPPARALVFALPITLVLLALAAKVLFPELGWAEAFLLGAVLSPTDPVVTSAVVASKRVPGVVRHTLNLESGLNDGLALPFVLFFLVLATAEGNAGSEAAQLVGEGVLGIAVGVALALAAAYVLPRLPGGSMEAKYEGAYALGLGFAAFGLAEVISGNGLIAAFVAGMALAAARHEIPDTFHEFSESLGAVFNIATFFAFGALVVSTDWEGSVWPILAFIAFALFVARPVAVLVSFVGVQMPRPGKLFIAWFGPKGVASILFALFVLASTTPDRTLIFDVAAYVILASILAHGLTDTVGARWIEQRIGET